MKTIAIILLGVSLLFSCNSNSDKSTDQSGNPQEVKADKGSMKSCDDFLKDYEKWVDEVIEVYKKVKENPMDMTNTTKAMEASQKLAEYSTKWTALYDCANSKKYAKKMEELEKKVEQAMNE